MKLAAIVFASVLLAQDGTQGTPQDTPKDPPRADLKVGDVVPDIMMKTFDGKELKLSDFRGENGQVVVVYFQSEKCPVALKPADVKKIAEPWTKADSKVKFIAVYAYHKETDATAQKYHAKHELPYAGVWDTDLKAVKHFGAKKVNTTVVIDKDGKLVYRGGYMSKNAVLVEQAVKAAMGEGTAPESHFKFAG